MNKLKKLDSLTKIYVAEAICIWLALIIVFFSGCAGNTVSTTVESSHTSAASLTVSSSAPTDSISSTVSPESQQVDVVFDEAIVTRITDGDTIWANTAAGEIKIRLNAIDTPESVHSDPSKNTEEGTVASDYLKFLINVGDTVYLQSDEEKQDKYGRELRYVWLSVPNDPFDGSEVSSKMVNAILVRDGYAQAKEYLPNELYTEVLNELGNRAIAENRGVSYFWANQTN